MIFFIKTSHIIRIKGSDRKKEMVKWRIPKLKFKIKIEKKM